MFNKQIGEWFRETVKTNSLIVGATGGIGYAVDAVSRLELMNGWLRFSVDASDDTRNIWWAIAQTTLTDQLDLEPFTDPDSRYGLRMDFQNR